jgi:alpha-amylase
MSRRYSLATLILIALVAIAGCGTGGTAGESPSPVAESPASQASPAASAAVSPTTALDESPTAADPTTTPDLPTPAPTITVGPTATAFPLEAGWWDSAVCYEVFVRSFYDSDGDGVGDLNGLIERLDYINDGDPATDTDLGANCIWLMPIAESPSYHGYDVVDYYTVDQEYGTNDDFKRLMEEARARGIRVILDLVLNHTSVEHPWFKEAARDPASPYRDWYLWSNDHPGYNGPWNEPAWHQSPASDEFYYGIFWSGMPDLNYRNPGVTEEAQKISAFWLREMGADGFRLDAIKHLIENGRVQENTPETHAWLREYRDYLQEIKPEAWTVGEIFGANPTTLRNYYPDQLDSYFVFNVGEQIIASANGGTALSFVIAAQQVEQALPFQRYAPFLTNHDQNRTMTVLREDVGKARIAATALLTLPGLPFVYYGEEIGMIGAKPDEDIRTPMQWNGESGAGFTTGQPWRAPQRNYSEVNVAAQDGDPESLLNLYRGLIKLHTSESALAQGSFTPLQSSNIAAGAYLRHYEDSAVLVVLNFGVAPAEGVALSAEQSSLAPGEYALTDYALPSLAPQTGYVFRLTP